ncbi:pyroglutamyl-peptidase I [Bifidobacterium vespertilionis]|uniref:Pyrrolidone-carboxylate peptidase n=1 Tax=Bifidobacterium vespertilionis TaxID=2562524 RepID=A0A5J5DSC1_9BIFI|nr:pyroglutamyl-peptidase I [Bifidobacterium vespertilionis]KAA8816184.1 pyroglutamyl-peptidase I [Bifidobacterium vespertilionis]KAA8821518.1 pyroglutamyl-peptidase I [Bifidobacterium vespertilionis]
MTTVLITGFDPFGGEKVNPAFESVKLLPDTIAGADIVKLEVPTVYTRSATVLEEAMDRVKPDIVICVGQAGGRSTLTVERVAINLAEARIPDNDGEQPLDQPLREDGDTAYFSSVPVKAMVQNIRDHGLPAFVSYTAGTFVCNSIMYNLLYLIDRKFPGVKGGFIHVPYEPGQLIDKPNGTPSLPLETIAKGLEAAVEAAVLGSAQSGDPTGAMGETH